MEAQANDLADGWLKKKKKNKQIWVRFTKGALKK